MSVVRMFQFNQYLKTGTPLLATLAITWIVSGPLWALPDDREQDLEYTADDFEFDENKQTVTISGSVVMEQGSMRIDADKVVIYNQDDKVTKIIATGNPARYQQLPAINQEPIRAKANRLEYQVEQETIHLIDNASLVQQGTSLTGSRIDYDVRKSVVKASSDSNSSGKKKRVKMVIPPKSIGRQE